MQNDLVKSVAIYMHDLSGGGVERQALKLAQEFRRHGLSVILVLHSKSGDLRVPPDIPIHLLGSRRTLGDIPRLAQFLRKHRPDVLLANVDHNNVAALLAKIGAWSSTKVVICQHNALSPGFSSQFRWTYRLMPWMYRLLSPLMAAAVAVSAGIADEMRTVIPHNKVRVINNAVIGEDFEQRVNEPASHRWFDQSGTVFVTAGRLVAPKDHETMLRAFALHLRRHHDSKLLIFGTGELHDHLIALTANLGISGSVDFLGFHDNPLPYFRMAHCFVLSSNSEGFGNVIAEALGCGTPVISTDCPHGPAEILDHGRYGVLTRAADISQLAAAMDAGGRMRAIWTPEALRTRAGEFTDAVCATKYIALFNAAAYAPELSDQPLTASHSINPINQP